MAIYYIIFRYYYNCNTEVSQWEKPREWLDYEKSLARQNYHVSSWFIKKKIKQYIGI